MSIDFLNVCAQKKMGEGWVWRTSEVISGGFLLTGAKPIGTVTRGPRKGAPKFPPPREYQKVVITFEERDAAYAEYESATGKCYVCEGKGEENYGWSREEGQKFRTCSRCKGTGAPPASEPTLDR